MYYDLILEIGIVPEYLRHAIPIVIIGTLIIALGKINFVLERVHSADDI